ncbi:MAG TPA: GntR family transcriptional regulator [Syntrophorhabdaceae bacterium]|jgi:GntR family transcriptional regulator
MTARQLIKIDRKSFRPAYIQLVQILSEQIGSGDFRPGQRLPSESQLCERYDVSPMTVRRAINILVDQGLVTTAQGKGTFVKPMELSTVTFGLDELRDFFRKNEQTKVKLLEVRIVKADANVAAKLNLSPGERTILIRRLIIKDDEPVFSHQEYIIYDPTRPVVEAEMEVTALHGLLTGSGETSLKRGELSIEATVLDDAQARLLKAPVMLPSFRLEHTFYDFEDRPVSWGVFICRGDRLRFVTVVGIPRAADFQGKEQGKPL